MTLDGRMIVVLAYPGYQELEFWYPVLRGREEGATVRIVAASSDTNDSYLGYPVLGDTAAQDIAPDGVDALVVPGTVTGPPGLSTAQHDLIKAVHASGRAVYALGTAVDVVTELIGALSPDRIAVDADALPEFVTRLRTQLAPASA